ncbi:MAG: hypothetical protein AVDCRST_MAG13-3573, partial [uncultured Solirubrobacteraceae bacterium]
GVRRGQELRGHRQGQGAAQQGVPVPPAHRADAPDRDRADAVGGGRHDRRPRPRGRPARGDGDLPPRVRRVRAARARDRGDGGHLRARRAARGARRPGPRGRPAGV